MFRRSTDGGASFGPESFVCGTACKTIRWQYDPQIRVANDTNPGCSCGTIYVAFLDQFDPGVQLFTSHDGGDTWSHPITMNGGLSYMDKPILVISPSGRDIYVAFNHKFDNMVVASHNYGQSFLPPQKVNDDQLWWYANSGAIAPNGDVYFALDGEASISGHGHDFDGSAKVALLRCSPSPTRPCANPTLIPFGVSAAPPPCPVARCYPDYYAATGAIAIDATGHMAFAYTFSSQANGPKSLYVRTSNNGVNWSARTLGQRQRGLDLPADRHRPDLGRFPSGMAGRSRGSVQYLVCPQRGRRDHLGTARSAVEPGCGTRYKSPGGYTFPDGDYFGMAVSSTGIAT